MTEALDTAREATAREAAPTHPAAPASSPASAPDARSSQDRLLGLLRTRRFAPLFAAQFLGAFNDNLYKQAMVILLTFRVAAEGSGGLTGATLASLAGAAFITPFVLFSAFAGAVSERSDKAVLLRRLKLAELGVMVIGAVALVLGQTPLLFLALFLAGLQATFLGPVKFAILPVHLRRDELVGGNALVEGATFLAILVGSVLGGLLVASEAGVRVLAAGLVLTGLVGYGAALLVPPAPPSAAGRAAPLRFAVVADTLALIVAARSHRGVWRCILAVSWFWTVGATVLALVPAFAREALGGDEHVATFILALFSVGIGLGSLACAKVLDGEVSSRLAPRAMAALGLALLGVGAARLLGDGPAPLPGASDPHALRGVVDVLSTLGGAATICVMSLAAFAAGFYAVPVYTLMQTLAPEGERSRIVAANNVVNALCMTLGAAIVAALTGLLGVTVSGIVAIVGAACLVVAALNARYRPEDV